MGAAYTAWTGIAAAGTFLVGVWFFGVDCCRRALLIVTGAMVLKLAHGPIGIEGSRGTRNIAVVRFLWQWTAMFRVWLDWERPFGLNLFRESNRPSPV